MSAGASDTTRASQAFVELHLGQAESLGVRLVDLLGEPDTFVLAAGEGLAALGDPAYETQVRRIIPGVGRMFGVRGPLHAAVTRALRPAVRELSPAQSLHFTERLSGADVYEVRSLAFTFLRRSLPADAERTWQLMRRLAANSTNWAHVDVLASLVASGIVLEPYRWVELEQLVYSPDRWERRLVGSTIAVIPTEAGRRHRERLVGSPALSLLGALIGDAEPDVQKALSWALRSWIPVEPAETEAFLEAETERAERDRDGHRAWVIRDALSALPAERARGLRDRLAGIRRRADAPSTSRAAEAAAPLADLASRHAARESWQERWAVARVAHSAEAAGSPAASSPRSPSGPSDSAMSLSDERRTAPDRTDKTAPDSSLRQTDENGSRRQS